MDGYKTWTGIIVTILGVVGIAKYIGGTEQVTEIVDTALKLGGLIFAAYGNYKAHKKIGTFKASSKN